MTSKVIKNAAILLLLAVNVAGCNNKTKIDDEELGGSTADDCEDVQPTFLKGTAWKLAGIVDIPTGELSKLEPEDCEACFTLFFDTDYIFTSLNIRTKWRLDLCNLTPANVLVDTYKCEPYDGKDYGKSYQDFDNGLFTTSSYSVNNDELKLFCYFGRSYMSFIPHDGENPSTSRIGTVWKLSGVVDVQSGELKVLEPQSSSSYSIRFLGDYLVRITSILANTEYNILNLERLVGHAHDPCWPEQMKYVDYWTAEYDRDNEGDSYLFRYAIDHVKEYDLTHNELKLFFEYQGKDYYLNFKLTSQ